MPHPYRSRPFDTNACSACYMSKTHESATPITPRARSVRGSGAAVPPRGPRAVVDGGRTGLVRGAHAHLRPAAGGEPQAAQRSRAAGGVTDHAAVLRGALAGAA